MMGLMTSDPRTGIGVAVATISAGVGQAMNVIPDDIGKLGAAVGVVLSLVLIYSHWRNGRIQYEKTRVEIDILQSRERARAEHVKRRLDANLPNRRRDDDA